MKTVRKIVAVLSIAALTAQFNITLGQAQLGEIINYALEHSREVKKTALQTEEMKYRFREAAGKGLPQASASASYSKINLPEIEISQEMITMIPEETLPLLTQLGNIDAFYSASAGIQVTQLVYNQAYLTGLKTAGKAVELSGLLKNKTEEDVIMEVATNFYQALSLYYQQKTLEKSLANLNEIYRMAELGYQNDFVKENDVNRLKVAITNLSVNLQTVESAIVIQLSYLKALAGMPADTILMLDIALTDDFALLQDSDADFDVWNVTDYQLLQKQGELDYQEIKLAKAGYSPTLAVYGKLNYSSYAFDSGINKLSNMNSFGIQLKMPLFTSGVTHAKVKQAQIKQMKTDETILESQDLLLVDYNNALTGYKTARGLLEVQRDNRKLALNVYDQISLQYREGMASMADLLNVNSDYLQAENSYYQQILRCRLAGIKIMKSSGTIRQLTKE